MSAVPEQLSDYAAIEEIEQGLADGYRAWATWDEIEIHDGPEIVWTLTSIPYPMFNAVLRSRLSPDGADSCIEGILAHVEERSVSLAWYVSPLSGPSDLGGRLKSSGFSMISLATGMTADLQDLLIDVSQPDGMTIEAVKDEEGLRDWCSVMAQVFEMPDFATDAMLRSYRAVGFGEGRPCQHYLARMEGLPVGTSSLFLGRSAATLANVATLADFRRQGVGSSVTLAPLVEARKIGYRLGTLCAYDIGKGVYQSLGFIERCKMEIYMWQ